MRTAKEIGQDIIEHIARKVVLEGDRRELVDLYEMMRAVTDASLAAGDYQGAMKVAEANSNFARSVQRACDVLAENARRGALLPAAAMLM